MRVTLIVVEGPHTGRSFTFDQHDTFLVGRSPDAHFALLEKDGYVSRFHFLVEVNPPLCRLLDLGSHNGTFVNGTRVEAVDLENDAKIEIGHTTLCVRLGEAEAEPATRTLNVPSVNPASDFNPVLFPSVAARLEDAQRELRLRWKAGDRVPVEQVLVRRPELKENPSAVVELAYAEFVLRKLMGEQPTLEEYVERFPHLADALRRQFAVDEAFDLDDEFSAADTRKPIDMTGTTPAGMPVVPGYQLLRELGRGAMGVVYYAEAVSDGRPAAIKLVIPSATPTQTTWARFAREAGVLNRLNHPRIVGFREFGKTGEQLFFVMEYVSGTDAAALVKRHGPMPIGRGVRLVAQALEGLAHAHAAGFVHRDIKPANLIVSGTEPNEAVKIADFGLARTYHASQLSGLTVLGTTGGTLAFMPPEQVTDFRSVKPAADQFAAAATLYFLLTGKYIHDPPPTTAEWFKKILHSTPIPIRSRRAEIPPELAETIHRALARKPDDRYPDVAVFRDALKPFEAMT